MTPRKQSPSTRRRGVIIALIIVAAVLVFLLLFSVSKRPAVGKAIAITPAGSFNPGTAGAIPPLRLADISGNTFSLVLGANPGYQESAGYEFQLSFPSTLTVTAISPRVNWGNDAFQRPVTFPASSPLHFEYATIDYQQALPANSGSLELARVTFQIQSGYTLTQADLNQIFLQDFKVWSLSPEPANLITSIQSVVAVAPLLPDETQQATLEEAQLLTPSGLQPSRCGDGLLGYIDGNVQGQDDNDPDERCDEGSAGGANRNQAPGGCAADCLSVELGYDCSSTAPSVCSPLSPPEYFLKKVTALLRSQCYPDQQHPEALYCSQGTPALSYDANGKLSSPKKFYLLAQLGTALKEFFEGVA